MKKVGSIVLFVMFVVAFLWLQRSIVHHREHFRVEEKILLVSDDPQVTKIGALGFDNLFADLGWIRAIQYFGGNFTTLNQPKKRDGFVRLMETLVALDERFVAAWKFGGFAFNESVRDATLAIDFLSRGTEKNPGTWQLPFDAGFVCYYQLGDTTRAKEYFEEAYSRSEFTIGRLARLTFQAKPGDEGKIQLVPTGDISGLVGLIPHELASAPSTVATATMMMVFGELNQDDSTATFDIGVQHNTQNIAAFGLPVAYDPSVYEYRNAVAASELGYGTFTVRHVQEGLLLVSGDYIDPGCPSYVPRMAIEMDYAAGKFLSAWEQYLRYFQSATERGDEISATIASDKLDAIYNTRSIEILSQAVDAYQQETGTYPSTDMHELLESGTLMKTVQKLVEEDPDQRSVIFILTDDTNIISHLLWERPKPEVEKPEPHILVIEEIDGKDTPIVYNRYDLVERQKSILERLQTTARAYTEEKGHPPSNMKDIENWVKEGMFTQDKGRPPSSPEELEEWFSKTPRTAIPDDPLGGEYYLDQDGKVQVRNLKY